LKDELRGRRLKCKSCGNTFEALEEHWMLKMRGGQVFGPMSRGEIDQMATDGLVTMDCQVLKEGSGRWEWAGHIFKNAAEEQSIASRKQGEVNLRAGGLPSSGLIQRLQCVRADLPRAVQERQMAWDNQIIGEANRSPVGFGWTGSKTIQAVTSYHFGPRFADLFSVAQARRPESPAQTATVTSLSDGLDEYLVVATWKGNKRLHREFFSLVGYPLSHGVTLTPHSITGSLGVGDWKQSDGNVAGPVATVVRREEESLAKDVRWGDGASDWAIQAIPLGKEQFFFAAQSAEKGPFARYIGLDWFVGRRNAFARVCPRIARGTDGDYRAEFLMPSFSAQVFAAMFGAE
jgi:hypothetical protein